MEIKKQLIVGLPETGKTTFLAALWHVVESGEVEGSLVVSEVHGVRDHLNRIRADWLNCRQMERTTIPAERSVSFKLRDPQSQAEVELSLPDLSGETFRLQWETRQWTEKFDRLASECSGAMLFVHPRNVQEPVRIDSVVDAMASTITTTSATAANALHASETEPWSPACSPTQVKLVEILQFLRARPFLDRTLPLAVIVSAWDVVSGAATPAKWLEARMPLLAQFLEANTDGIPSQIYGVSAQGGELSAAKELQKHHRPSDRIIVTMPNGSTTHDITSPLRWLLER